MTINTVGDAARELQRQLGLHEGFFHSILDEDDWSFIVKMHALMEAAVTHLLTERVGHAPLEGVFSFTEFANKRSGKLAFAKALNVLDSDERRFLYWLAELRNSLVHGVKNVQFDLDERTRRMNRDQFGSFVKACDIFSSPGSGNDGINVVNDGSNIVPVEQLFKDNPKLALWNAGIAILSTIYCREELHARKAKQIEAREPAK